MWWRNRRGAAENRAAIEALVRDGNVPGLLAYDEQRAVGWISLGPREEFGQLLHSKAYRPLDQNEGIWCVTCMYVHGAARHAGVASDHGHSSAKRRQSRRFQPR